MIEMDGHYKRYNARLYEENDGPAKQALIRLLKGRGHKILNTEETYDADIVSESQGVLHYNEAEIKKKWTGQWPTYWSEIRIPERKRRLLEKHKGNCLNFFVFRKDLKQVWRIRKSLMKLESLKTVKGYDIHPDELFFHIPYTEAELYDVE